MVNTILQVTHWIGSAVPLTILCLMIALIMGGKKVKWKTVGSYIVVSFIMFLILSRT